MPKCLKSNMIVEFITILYISLMLYTAVSKLSDYNLSREQMAMMPLLRPISHIVAWLLPMIEIMLAVLVFLPVTRVKGLYGVTGLMVLFTIYIMYMMTNYQHLPCSCGGLIETLSWTGHLVFNLIYIMLGILAIVLHEKGGQSTRNYAPAVSPQ